jgi:hypothetical protein
MLTPCRGVGLLSCGISWGLLHSRACDVGVVCRVPLSGGENGMLVVRVPRLCSLSYMPRRLLMQRLLMHHC